VPHISTWFSLAVIGAALAGAALTSLAASRAEQVSSDS
jgi:hypothetical protein